MGLKKGSLFPPPGPKGGQAQAMATQRRKKMIQKGTTCFNCGKGHYQPGTEPRVLKKNNSKKIFGIVLNYPVLQCDNCKHKFFSGGSKIRDYFEQVFLGKIKPKYTQQVDIFEIDENYQS